MGFMLRKMGIIKAVKRLNRETNEGTICYEIKGKKAAIIKLTSETDFVAKNNIFLKLAKKITSSVNSFDSESIEKFLENKIEGSMTTSDLIKENIGRLGENIVLKNIKKIFVSKGIIIPYVHNKYDEKTGKIIVLVALEGNITNKIIN